MAPQSDKDKEEAPLEHIDAIAHAGQSGLAGAGFGLLAAALQNSLAKNNVGVLGVFRLTRIWVTYPGMLANVSCQLGMEGFHWSRRLNFAQCLGVANAFFRRLKKLLPRRPWGLLMPRR